MLGVLRGKQERKVERSRGQTKTTNIPSSNEDIIYILNRIAKKNQGGSRKKSEI